MKEEQALANHQQTRYALGKPMNGASPAVAEMTHAGEGSPRPFHRPSEVEAVQQGIDAYVAAEIAHAKEFAEKKAAKERLEKEKEKKPAVAQAPSVAQASEDKLVGEKAKPLPKESYFRRESAPAELSESINAFLLEAAGRQLSEVETPVLVRHYLILRRRALEKAISISFLDDIQGELANRGVDIISLVSEAREKLTQVQLTGELVGMAREEVSPSISKEQASFEQAHALAKAVHVKETFKQAAPAPAAPPRQGLDLTGITDPKLRNFGESINHAIGQVGLDHDRLMDYLGQVAFLENVDEGQRQLLLGEIGAAVREARQRGEEGRRGLYHERILTAQEKEDIEQDIERVVAKQAGINAAGGKEYAPLEGEHIDFIFNRMFEYSNPRQEEDFHTAFGSTGEFERIEFQAVLSDILSRATRAVTEVKTPAERQEASRKKDIARRFIEKYGREYHMRELLHNAFFIPATEGEFEQFAKYCQQFASDYADLAFLDAPEVEAALRIREDVLYKIKQEHNGFIPPELVAYNPSPNRQGSVWDENTREIMEELNRRGMFRIGRARSTYEGKTSEEIDPWRLERAIAISRGLGMVFLRFPEIVAEQPLSAPPGTNQAWLSPPWEKLVWELNPLDYKIKKYAFGNKVRAAMYATLKRTSKGVFDFWNQDELERATMQDAITSLGDIHGDRRVIDMRNIFRTGGPFTHTGWRPYVASLLEDRSGLRPLLAQNPGLAMQMIFNRYETLDQGTVAYAISKNDMEAQQKLDDWVSKGKGETPESRKKWTGLEKNAWVASSRRIPHIILRIITDPANGLLDKGQREGIYAYLAGADGINESLLTHLGKHTDGKETTHSKAANKLLAEIAEDLTFAKEHLMKRRRDALAEARRDGKPEADVWTADKDQLTTDDFNAITDQGRRARAKNFHEAVVRIMSVDPALPSTLDFLKDDPKDPEKGLLNRITTLVDKRGFPFAVTAADVPWSEFAFGQTGTRGYFTRKNNDAFSVARANGELEKYLKNIAMMTSPEQLIEQLKKIYEAAEEYDQNRARDAIEILATGTIRFFQKDGLAKIPILGEVLMLANKARGRGNSFAETHLGGKAGAWDSDDIYNFTEHLRQILTKDQIDRIRKETGGTWAGGFFRKTKLALYLLLLFGSYELISNILKTEK